MTRRFRIHSSVLVQLLTDEPEARLLEFCVTKPSALVQDEAGEIFLSNQVIGEAYIAVQHHYGVSKNGAHAGLLKVLRTGLVAPLNGEAVLEALCDFGIFRSSLGLGRKAPTRGKPFFTTDGFQWRETLSVSRIA